MENKTGRVKLLSSLSLQILSPSPPTRRVGMGGRGFPNQIEISLKLSVISSERYCVDIMNLLFS